MNLDGIVEATDSFGQGFALAQKDEWKDFYIDYAAVMELLSRMKDKNEEEYASRRVRRGHRSHASTSFLLDLAPQTIGETSELESPSSKFEGGLIRRMSEGGLSILNHAPFRNEKRHKNGTRAPEEEKKRAVRRSRGESWPLDSSETSARSSSSSLGPVKAGSDQDQLCTMLDDELENVGLFFLQEQGRISNVLHQLAREKEHVHTLLTLQQQSDSDNGLNMIAAATEKLIEGYRAAGMDLLELFHFVAMNMTVLRKLLNRHDALVRRYGDKPPLLREWYVLSRTEDKRAYLSTLLTHNGLMAIEGTVRRGVIELIKSQQKNDGTEPNVIEHVEALTGEPHLPELYFDVWSGNVEAVAAKMRRAERNTFDDFVVAGSLGNNIAFEPSILKNRFQPTMDQGDADMKFYVDWRKRERLMEARLDVAGEKSLYSEMEASTASATAGLWPIGLQLNLFSTFLYMTNYFVAGPTSVKYVHALGGHAALASMVIGATPWAVMASTFLFSIWTNYSFKSPLIMSGVLLCLGNLMYATALKFDSIILLLAGRTMIGFGGPRLINRRYIADTATLQQRTAVSAAFVTFSASGTAAGPGLSIILQNMNTTIRVPLLGKFKINGLTAPGYAMFLLWLLFFFVVIFAFEEPNRTGLEQQKSVPRKLTTQKSTQDESSLPSEVEGLVLSDSQDGHEHYGSVTKPDQMSGVEESITDEASQLNDESSTCCLFKITWPVVVCLLMLFVDKLAIESLISSSPIITENRYDWSVHRIGALGVMIGLLVIPLSICIGWLSRRYEDGRLLLWLLYFTTFGLILLLDVSELGFLGQQLADYGFMGVGAHRYVYGCLFSFSGLQAMESIIMSTLSKVVPFSLAVGTCNSGLLNTEIGTFGRAFGDVMVTFIGFASLENLLDSLVIPLVILMIGCIVLVNLNYSIFVV